MVSIMAECQRLRVLRLSRPVRGKVTVNKITKSGRFHSCKQRSLQTGDRIPAHLRYFQLFIFRGKTFYGYSREQSQAVRIVFFRMGAE